MSSADSEPDGMPSSWDVLQAPYFSRTCRSVLDSLMAERSFHLADATDERVIYALGDRFLEYCYLVEDSPTYILMVNLGHLDQRPDGGLRLQGVGLWRFLPRPGAPSDHAMWEFADEASLRRVITTTFGAVIEPLALPILGDPARLVAAIDAQRREIESAYHQAREFDCVARARSCFDAGHYEEAVRQYEQLDQCRLAASDRRKLELARRRTTEHRN